MTLLTIPNEYEQQRPFVNKGVEMLITGYKVQAQIQGEQVRVTGKKRDDLQQVMALAKEADLEQPLQFTNFRD